MGWDENDVSGAVIRYGRQDLYSKGTFISQMDKMQHMKWSLSIFGAHEMSVCAVLSGGGWQRDGWTVVAVGSGDMQKKLKDETICRRGKIA